MNPNSFDKEIKDAQNANPETPSQGTEPEKTVNPTPAGEQTVDYKTKFAESSKEALRLFEENKKLQEELSAKANGTAPAAPTTDNLYPGFEQLDPEAQANLVAYTDMIKKKTMEGVYQDPAIKFARNQYNTTIWNEAFGKVAEKYPELKDDKSFRDKYFKVDVVPDNIESILSDVAKIHLFDKAKDIGAQEEKKKIEERVDLERATGGEKTPTSARSLEDWNRMARENPAKFAKLGKEFNADISSGKI